MALAIRTNIASLVASNRLNRTNADLGGTVRRISSGTRVSQAADDAAGLGVATRLETNVLSTRQAIRNTNDGISLVQTAESAANEVTDILQRMRELAVQSSSETLADDERSYIQDEFSELSEEVARIASVTEFNGVSLTDGSITSLDVQVGVDAQSSARITVDLTDLTTTTLGVRTSDVSMDTVTSARSALAAIDTALDTVSGYHSQLGSFTNRLDSTLTNNEVYAESLSAAEGRIMDADFAHETSEMTRLQIMQQAGVASLAQAKNMNASVTSLIG